MITRHHHGQATFGGSADFRNSLRCVFDEARAKQFNTTEDFRKITATILKFLAVRRTMTGAQARASCPIRLPDGKPVDTHIAYPSQNLVLTPETSKRLQEADTDQEFLGILLSTEYEQMMRSNSPGCKPSRRRKKRARGVVHSSPEQSQSPSKKARLSKAAQNAQLATPHSSPSKLSKKVFRHDDSALLAAREKSEALQAACCNDAVHGFVSTDPKHAGEQLTERIINSDGEMEVVLKSGRIVQLPAKSSSGSSPSQRGSDAQHNVHVDAKADDGGKLRWNGKSPPVNGETKTPVGDTDQDPKLIRSSSVTQTQTRINKQHHANAVVDTAKPSLGAIIFDQNSTAAQRASHNLAVLPQTPTRPSCHQDEQDSSYIDSDDDTPSRSRASAPIDIDNPEGGPTRTSGQKLAIDIGNLLQMSSRRKEESWADKAALLEWLKVGHEQVLKRNGEDPTALLGPAARLDNIIRHISHELKAVSPGKRARHIAKLKDFCDSSYIHAMNYEQRLRKAFEIIYLEEELDAVAMGEWTRLEGILGLCSIIADAISPEDEVIDEETKNRWISAKKMSIASLKTLLGAKERCRNLGLL